MIEDEFNYGVGDGELGLQDFMGFLLAIELFLVGGRCSGEGRGRGNEMCGGKSRFEVGLPAHGESACVGRRSGEVVAGFILPEEVGRAVNDRVHDKLEDRHPVYCVWLLYGC